MHKFVRNLLTEWRKLDLPFGGEPIIAAVSGGADSVALALALRELIERKKLGAFVILAHFNHQLRQSESDEDENFARNLARKLRFEFYGAKGEISPRGNLEQNARAARYEFLIKTAEKFDAKYVLTAHTVNDQAETFLLNLLRGSGADGLAAMRIIRPLSKNTSLIRPLLNWAQRADTESFCAEKKVEFRLDAMNDDLKFSRIRIRKELIPFLKTYNPKIVETLAKTAGLLDSPEIEKKNHLTDLEKLPLKLLISMEKSARGNFLRLWLKKRRGNLRGIVLKHLEAIESLILSRKSGRVVELLNGEKVVKSGGMLLFEKT